MLRHLHQFKLFLGMVSFFLLSGCSGALMQPTLPDQGVDLFSEDISESADFEQTAVSGGRTTVILDIDDQGQSLARSAELKTLLASKMIGDLNAVGVDDLNRNSERKLIEEIKLIEVSGKAYDGPVLADYAVFATFIESRFEVVYEKPFKVPFSDEEAYRRKPGTCAYSVTVHLGLKIKDLSASARTVKSLNVKETREDSFESTNKNCPVPNNEKNRLARIATEHVAECLTLPLQQFLAPRGRITESRQDDKGRSFFRISTGKEGGMKVGDVVIIYSQRASGEQNLEDYIVAEGVIHKASGANFAWVMVTDASEASLIKRSDLAKVSYEGKFSKSSDWFHCRSIRMQS